MKTLACIAASILTLLLVEPLTTFAGTYYPYQSYDQYYKEHSATPPPGQKPPAPPPPPAQVKPPPRPEPLVSLTEPPDFLFPPELGFGVAVGVPYDLFYVGKEFYVIKGGNWYRSHSYNGPWILAGTSLPPELRKQKLTKIRELRSREFAKYYKDREHYKGKHYRPGDEHRLPTKKEERERGR